MANVTVSRSKNWKNFFKKYVQQPEVKIGILNGATYQGDFGTSAGQTVADVAYKNEFGTAYIPPRPFFRNTIQNKKDEWIKIAEAEAKRGQTPEQVLISVGETAVSDIVDTIKEGVEPKLAESTLADRRRRGLTSTTPLMATMTLIKTIDFEVTK